MSTRMIQPGHVGFHSGELAVQRRAGVEAEAARLRRMVAPGELRGGVAALLADASFAAVTARDRDGRLWISPVTGQPGFLAATTPTRLSMRTALKATRCTDSTRVSRSESSLWTSRPSAGSASTAR